MSLTIPLHDRHLLWQSSSLSSAFPTNYLCHRFSSSSSSCSTLFPLAVSSGGGSSSNNIIRPSSFTLPPTPVLLKPPPPGGSRSFIKNRCYCCSSAIRAAATNNSSVLLQNRNATSNCCRWWSCLPKIRTDNHVGSTGRGQRVVCSAAASLPPHTLQWISAISCLVLMFAKGSAIQKSFLVPLFALQAPISVISWIKGEYGTGTAFLVLLVRLFYFIPGELDLPFLAILLVIVAPYQTMDLRGTQAGAIISLVIVGYLAFQHFSRAGSLQRAFDQGSLIATLAVICIISVPCLLLF